MIYKTDSVNNTNPIHAICPKNHIYKFEQSKYSEYNFCGKIIYNHSDIIIVDVMCFKFYIENNNNDIANISIGQFLSGNGILNVDPYIFWKEKLHKDVNCPDIFYNLIIDKIFELKIPEKYIARNNGCESGPSSLPIKEYNNVDMKEIIKMDSKGEYISYMLNLNENIEKTSI